MKMPHNISVQTIASSSHGMADPRTVGVMASLMKKGKQVNMGKDFILIALHGTAEALLQGALECYLSNEYVIQDQTLLQAYLQIQFEKSTVISSAAG